MKASPAVAPPHLFDRQNLRPSHDRAIIKRDTDIGRTRHAANWADGSGGKGISWCLMVKSWTDGEMMVMNG